MVGKEGTKTSDNRTEKSGNKHPKKRKKRGRKEVIVPAGAYVCA
jgi:hypothetical protein